MNSKGVEIMNMNDQEIDPVWKKHIKNTLKQLMVMTLVSVMLSDFNNLFSISIYIPILGIVTLLFTTAFLIRVYDDVQHHSNSEKAMTLISETVLGLMVIYALVWVVKTYGNNFIPWTMLFCFLMYKIFLTHAVDKL